MYKTCLFYVPHQHEPCFSYATTIKGTLTEPFYAILYCVQTIIANKITIFAKQYNRTT